ncbi:MAG: lamin tail domain-containing protein [Euryarchaeota archaeon]|nr:lamin tail domain-containing protein [Euryarchaeota archaeon]
MIGMKLFAIAAIAALALTAMMTCTSAGNADKAPSQGNLLVISEALFDPVGTETEGEFVELVCASNRSASIGGWTLTDQDGPIEITFPNMTLAPGELVVVWTGAGTNQTSRSPYEFHIGRTTSVWNNPGDDVLLLNSTGNVSDYICYGNGSAVDPCPAPGSWPNISALPKEGISLALKSDDAWGFSVPTPGARNPEPAKISSALITEVSYDPGKGSEYVKVVSNSTKPLNLYGWAIADDSGVLAFPRNATLSPGEALTMAENATRFNISFGRLPDITWGNMTTIEAGFRLANAGDEVFLLDPWGAKVDAYAYGDSNYQGEGWLGEPVPVLRPGKVSMRAIDCGKYADTDSARDWDKTPVSAPIFGNNTSVAFTAANLTYYAFPDAGFQAVESLIYEARSSISLNVYELSSPLAAAALARAAGRVGIRVLSEGKPVSGLVGSSVECFDAITEAGGSVRLAINDTFDYNHAKYMVIDNRTLFLSTENWGASGLPAAGMSGNRGWAVAVRDANLSSYFMRVFESDWNSSIPWNASRGSVKISSEETPLMSKRARPLFPPMNSTESARVTPVLAPDNALSQETILGMLGGARRMIMVEEFYVHAKWGSSAYGGASETNPFVDALVAAARRGCEVRVLLDSTYYNVESGDKNDNDDAVRYLNTLAALEGLKIQAKLVQLEAHDFVKIHAKGVIVDESSVLVSSINWNRNSVMDNREAGLIVESGEAARYFARVFEYDWRDDFSPPVPEIRVEGTPCVGTTICFLGNGSRDDAGIRDYSWQIDGVNASSKAPTIEWVFSTPGEHEVTLNVTDGWGNANSTSISLELTNVTAETPEMQTSAQSSPTTVSNGTGASGVGAEGIWGASPVLMYILALPGVAVLAFWLIGRGRKGGRGKDIPSRRSEPVERDESSSAELE